MDDHVSNAVVHQHNLLAEWLGSPADHAVLAELRDAHTADFMLVTVDGQVLDRDTLLTALESAANAQPGLRIEITDVSVVAQFDGAVLVSFLETHLLQKNATSRRVTALLRIGSGALSWAYVHETPVRSDAPIE